MSDRGSLETYNQKRDFERTPEPRGSETRRKVSAPLEFVVQKHGARRLHYDFRLELDGVLKSWAVPKGPSLVPGEKRLAVATEDHPIAYASFEGVIPEKQYGAGPVVVWDRGYWFCEGDPHRALERGNLEFSLEGEKLRGGWRLVRMQDRDGAKDNWLLMKRRDQAARSGDPDALVDGRPTSILTGRDLDEVLEDADRTWHSDADVSKMVVHSLGDPAAIEGAKKSAMPKTIEPQLATLVDEATEGGGYLHEMKLDGYRLIARIDVQERRAKAKKPTSKGVQLFTRRGNDWTVRYPGIARDALRLGRRVILDGEAVVLDEHGIPDFQALQNAAGGETVVYYAFDLLHLDGYDLRKAPLRARKEALRLVLAACPDLSCIRYSDHIEGQGPAFLEHACNVGLEGIIEKRADAPYVGGRNRNWLKVKCRQRDEVVIIGFTAPERSRVGLGALLLATREEGRGLRYAGKVGTGFTDETLRSLEKQLSSIAIDSPAIEVDIPPRERRRVTWVEPELVAEIAFHGFTKEGTIRHGSFLGLREDKKPADVRIERPQPPAKPASAKEKAPRRTQAQRTARGDASVAGVRISHPDKVLFPEQGVTKVEIAEYYAEIADVVVPAMKDRPLTLVRCPEGPKGQCFYQKQAHKGVPKSIPRVEVKPGVEYLTVRRLEDLLSLVQLGVLEFHVWGSRCDRLDRPDILVFDLDPDPSVTWEHLLTTAEVLRERLAQLDLAAFARVTGGKGLHVVTPIERRIEWDDARAFTRGIAEELVRAAPDHYTANMSKARRKGKIFIDYLRNASEATAIASYSLRARQGAPIAVPVEWTELGGTKAVPRFHIEDVISRVRNGIDPWKDFDSSRGRITRALLREVG